MFEEPFAKCTPMIFRAQWFEECVCLTMIATQRKNILDILWVPVTSARQILSGYVPLECKNEG